MRDGWSNGCDPEECKGPFTVFMQDGSNLPDIASFAAAKHKADEQVGSKVRDQGSGATVYVSKEPADKGEGHGALVCDSMTEG